VDGIGTSARLLPHDGQTGIYRSTVGLLPRNALAVTN
jgi:hypothetical protein